MARDQDRPLLRLREAQEKKRTAKGRSARFPTDFPKQRQQTTFGPKFERIQAALAASDDDLIALQNDPTALAPETLIVFELKSSLVTFAQAINAIEGLELISEDSGDNSDEQEGEGWTGHYYAVFSDSKAMAELLSLWKRWSEGESLEGALKPWEKAFSCLSDLRRWGPKDRISAVHAEALSRVIEGRADNEILHLEVELIFRPGAAGNEIRTRARADLAKYNATEIQAARYEGFAFDAVLVQMSVADVAELAKRSQDSIAGLRDAFRIRPQSIGYGVAGSDRDAAIPRQDPTPSGDPVVAIFDGVPVANHPYLADRIRLDDPDGLGPMSVGGRSHGTAMTSLVIYGDLGQVTDVVNRPVYVRPFLVDTDNFPGVENERTLPNRILVDDLVRAVRRIKVGDGDEAPEAPEVVVINLSFGIPDLVFDETMSPLARCLDWLAWEHGILFVVSAGNSGDPLTVAAYADDAAFRDAANPHRTENVLAALRDIRNSQKLLSPAEAMNALTVGAFHADAINTAPNVGGSFDPLPEGRLPSIQSRIGLGYGRSAKPDILAPGGRLRVHLRPLGSPIVLNRGVQASRLGGLRVAGSVDPIQGAQLTWSGATSASAAMTTHALHKIHDALEEAYGDAFLNLPSERRALLLKALVVHRSDRPNDQASLIERVFSNGAQRHASVQKSDIACLFGFGILNEDESTACALNRATGWATGELAANRGMTFSFPLPVGLNAQSVAKAVTATACWFSPILPGRQGYRAVRLVIDENDPGFGDTIKSLGVKVSSNQLDSNGTRRGTVFHRRWEGARAANFQAGQNIEIKVSRMPDISVGAPQAVPFALAVSIEAEGNVPIYEQVLQGIDVALRPRVRVQVQT